MQMEEQAWYIRITLTARNGLSSSLFSILWFPITMGFMIYGTLRESSKALHFNYIVWLKGPFT
jgi:hypothetical protein